MMTRLEAGSLQAMRGVTPVRMMMKVTMDTQAATESIEAGRLAGLMQAMMEKLHPEAAYFGPEGGSRTAFIVFDMTDSAQLPPMTERLFSELKARVEIFPVMDREDLQRGLEALGT
jgi:hypothetical protein